MSTGADEKARLHEEANQRAMRGGRVKRAAHELHKALKAMHVGDVDPATRNELFQLLEALERLDLPHVSIPML